MKKYNLRTKDREEEPEVSGRQVKGKSEMVFQAVLNIGLILCSLAAILPFVMLLSSSLTSESALLSEGYGFWPKEFSLYAYEYLFTADLYKILRASGITLFVTVVGTVLSLAIGPMLAWTLTRTSYKHGKFLNYFVILAMLFNGGLVPSYIMWTQIFHIKNTIWALIFPNLLLNTFHIILYKNNFRENIHPSLVDSAKMDGAGEFYIYTKLVLPLSKPILATVGLMTALAYWNDWQNGLYYLTDTKLYSLQVLLNSIVSNIEALKSMNSTTISTADMPGTGIRMAMAVIGVVPILILYPFFQKYFVQGITLGGVKE